MKCNDTELSYLKANLLIMVYPLFALFELYSLWTFLRPFCQLAVPSRFPIFPSYIILFLLHFSLLVTVLYSPLLLYLPSSSFSFWFLHPVCQSFSVSLLPPRPPPGSNPSSPSLLSLTPFLPRWALQKDTFIPRVKFLLISASQMYVFSPSECFCCAPT